jgi:hypothetical protein
MVELAFGVSPVPKSEGPGAPSALLETQQDRGHPPDGYAYLDAAAVD